MEGKVYNLTTEPEVKKPRRLRLGCTLRHLRGWRLPVKVVQTFGELLTMKICKAMPSLWDEGNDAIYGMKEPARSGQNKRTIFSLVAVVCEELVEECYNCSALYFFEFVSWGAFLLSLLILCVYCTRLYESLGEDKVQKLNFWAVPVIGACFLSASILFLEIWNEPEELAACVFGFFATSAFAAEFGIELYLRLKQKLNTDGRAEKPHNTPSATENQPLNKKR